MPIKPNIKEKVSEALKARDELKIELEKELAIKEKEADEIRQMLTDLDPSFAPKGKRPGRAIAKSILDALEGGALDLKGLADKLAPIDETGLRLTLGRLAKKDLIEKNGGVYRLVKEQPESRPAPKAGPTSSFLAGGGIRR